MEIYINEDSELLGTINRDHSGGPFDPSRFVVSLAVVSTIMFFFFY